MVSMLDLTSDFYSRDAFEEELKFISLFSISNRIPFETILKMPRSRLEFLVKAMEEYNNERKREDSLLKNTGSKSGGLLG